MFDSNAKFHDLIKEWIISNNEHTYYVYASQQSGTNVYSFCKAVIDMNKIPIIITNVGRFEGRFSHNIQKALHLSDNVRVYEAAKMGMTVVLESKAKLFIETNGGILWTP